jgi:hypothetical protein
MFDAVLRFSSGYPSGDPANHGEKIVADRRDNATSRRLLPAHLRSENAIVATPAAGRPVVGRHELGPRQCLRLLGGDPSHGVGFMTIK